MANNSTTYARVTNAAGHATYVPVKLPARPYSNPRYVAVTARTLGANPRFKRG